VKSETGRGFNEARDQIEALRARWPKAFPLQAHEVRPLETATLDIIVNEMGWTRPYARAVLAVLEEAHRLLPGDSRLSDQVQVRLKIAACPLRSARISSKPLIVA
jgi:hypothetical protein